MNLSVSTLFRAACLLLLAPNTIKFDSSEQHSVDTSPEQDTSYPWYKDILIRTLPRPSTPTITFSQATIKSRDSLHADLMDPEKTYQENSDQVLIGVYNTHTKSVHLLPSVQQPVWLELNLTTREYTRGWALKSVLGKKVCDTPLNETEVSLLNSNPYPPRFISTGNGLQDYNRMSLTTPHTFLVELLGDMSNKSNYVGFTVLPTEESMKPNFIWTSYSLNSQDLLGLSKKMPTKYSDDIEKIIMEFTGNNRMCGNNF